MHACQEELLAYIHKIWVLFMHDDVSACGRVPLAAGAGRGLIRRLADGGEDLVVEVEGHGILPVATSARTRRTSTP